MVIFHSYVSVPEGKDHFLGGQIWATRLWAQHISHFWQVIRGWFMFWCFHRCCIWPEAASALYQTGGAFQAAHDRRAVDMQWTPNNPWAMRFCFPFLQVAVVQNMSYMSMPNGEKQYIFGKTDAGFAIADTWNMVNGWGDQQEGLGYLRFKESNAESSILLRS